jgi:lipoprotein-releasing system permease protein
VKSLEFSIAWRYLRSRRGSRLLSLISVIAIGGVLVGVSALIVIMGVMNGLQRDLRDKILVGTADINVLPYSSDLRLPGWESVRDRVAAVPGVAAAAPFVQTQGLILNPSGFTTGARVYGIEPDGVPDVDVTTIRTHAVLGDFRFRTADGARGVVLGKLLAAKLGTFLNDTIVLLGPGSIDMNAATGALIPRADSFVVTGIFETGMYEYDESYLYLHLRDAQRFAGIGEDVTGIEVRTRDREQAPLVAAALRSSIESPIRAVEWQESNRALFQALSLEKLGMSVILLLIVIVAAFNIVSTLTMVVTDKTREIGILKAMGMSARSIRRIFLLQGVVIGAVGTFGGLIVGLTVAILLERYHLISLDPSIYFIDHLPVATQPFDVLLIVIASLVIAAVATLYPAGQAARLYPVDAIRHE